MSTLFQGVGGCPRPPAGGDAAGRTDDGPHSGNGHGQHRAPRCRAWPWSLRSPSLQGVQSTTTDTKGEFRFASVPPGTYAVKVELSGFKIGQPDRRRGRHRPHGLAHLQARGRRRLRDDDRHWASPRRSTSASSTTGVNATADLFNRLPIRRDIYAIARVAAGHAGRRRRAPCSTAPPAPRTTTSSRASTRPAIRARHRGQDAELRLRRGDRGQDRRSPRRVRPHDRRRDQRPHEVRRQHRSRATSSASTRAAACRATTRRRASARHDHHGHRHRQPLRLRRRPRRLPASRTSCGSSAPTTARAAPTTITVIRQHQRAGQPRRRLGDPARHHAQPLRRQADLEPQPQPHGSPRRSSATPATIDGPGVHHRRPRGARGRARSEDRRAPTGGPLRRQPEQHVPGPRDVRPAQGEEHVSAARARAVAQLIDQTVVPNSVANGFGFFTGPGLLARRRQARPDQVRGPPRAQVRRRLRSSPTPVVENCNGGAGQRIYKLHARGRQSSTTATATTSTTSRRASTATTRPRGRSRTAHDLGAPLQELFRLPAGLAGR